MPESTEASVSSRPLFKKVKKSKIKARLRARSDDDDAESQSAMNAIEETRKKRKLMNEVQYKRGLDATLTVAAAPAAATATAAEPTTTKQQQRQEGLTERLKGTFSGGTGGDATSGEGGVLQRKHKDAMEEFVRQTLAQQQTQEEKSSPEQRQETNVNDMKTKLYEELASASMELAGTKPKQQAEEGDVGAGGAMLGGTGIAEVALPTEERIQTIKATEDAVASLRPQVLNRDAEPIIEGAGKSSSSSAVLGGTQKSGDRSSSAGFGRFHQDDVSNVPSSYSHNFQLHTQEWVQQKKQEEEQVKEKVSGDQVDTLPANHERMGFEAARQAARTGGESFKKQSQAPKKEAQKRSTDDRVWKSFVKHERESQDRYR